MTDLPISASSAPASSRVPVWPVVIAPLVAGLYYLSLRGSFAFSLTSVVSDASDLAPQDWGVPQWGSHWVYRALAELVSVPFGLYVAAGLARKRAKLAAIVGASAISAVYLLKNLGLLYAVYRWRYELIEPWSQHIVDALVIVGALYGGWFIGEAAAESFDEKSLGFAGINRWHFLWLWLPVAAYADGVISPLIHLWVDSFTSGGDGDFIRTIVLGVPVLAYGLPIFMGLSVLSGRDHHRRVICNTVGPAILIVGWFLATGIVFVWGYLLTKVFHWFSG
jgi:hypothetical protein